MTELDAGPTVVDWLRRNVAENGDQVAAFLANHSAFATLPWREAWAAGVGGEPPSSSDGSETSLLITPAGHGTDGFFIAVLARVA